MEETRNKDDALRKKHETTHRRKEWSKIRDSISSSKIDPQKILNLFWAKTDTEMKKKRERRRKKKKNEIKNKRREEK